MSQTNEQQLTKEQIEELKAKLKGQVAVNRQMKRQAARQERSNLSRQFIPENKFVDECGVVVTNSEKVIWHKKASNMPNQYLRMDKIGKSRVPQWKRKQLAA